MKSAGLQHIQECILDTPVLISKLVAAIGKSPASRRRHRFFVKAQLDELGRNRDNSLDL